jgi:hypothetical protein
MLIERDVWFLCRPEMVKQDGQLACNGHDGLVLRLLASARCHVQTPLSQRRVSTMGSQDMVRALDQQTSKIGVARLRDAELRIAFARLAAFWSQPKVAADVSTSTESRLISERQHEGKSSDMANSMDRHHGLSLDILGLSESLNILVILLDLESHLRDLSENRTERQLQSWRHRGLPSLSEAGCGRSRHTVTACLGQSANCVDGRGA